MNTANQHWYRQPIAWLAFLFLTASLGGCLWMILISKNPADKPLPIDEERLLTVPIRRPAGQ